MRLWVGECHACGHAEHLEEQAIVLWTSECVYGHRVVVLLVQMMLFVEKVAGLGLQVAPPLVGLGNTADPLH